MAGKTKRPANLQEHIHKILHGSKEEKEKLQRTFFYMAETPDFMKKLGLSGEYFSVRYGVISRHLGKDVDHVLKEKDWIDLCKKITMPFAIAKYGEGYRLFTSVKVNRTFVAVGVTVKNPGKNLEVNSVMTAFGYRGIPDQEKFIYKKMTPEHAALLERLYSSQYPPEQGPGRRT